MPFLPFQANGDVGDTIEGPNGKAPGRTSGTRSPSIRDQRLVLSCGDDRCAFSARRIRRSTQ
jgi:hypothetical protein